MAADDLALCKQAKESSNAPCVGALKERGTSNSPPSIFRGNLDNEALLACLPPSFLILKRSEIPRGLIRPPDLISPDHTWDHII